MFEFLQGRLLWVRICLLVCVLLLVSVGVATIYAVGHPAETSPASRAEREGWDGLYQKQLVFVGIGLVGFLVINFVSYRWLGSVSHWIFGGVLVLLTLLLVSKYSGGAIPFAPSSKDQVYRWIVLHPSLPRIQPSEFCKLAYVLTLAWYLRYRSNYSSMKALIGPFLLTLVPIVLILPEPDLGTVLLLIPLFFAMLFMAGAKVKHLLLIICMGLAVSPLLWFKMRTYQRERISGVLLQSTWVQEQADQKPWVSRVLSGKNFNSDKWMRDRGYQLYRSKIAIASGGLRGHGFRQGAFIKYGFLPEGHNDMVFAAIANQWGFLGCLGVLGLYGLIVLCSLEIVSHNTDPFGRLLGVGILALFILEVFVNVGMTIGLMPITGLTLPFVSYGGSSLLVSFLALGLLNNVGRSRRFTVAKKM